MTRPRSQTELVKARWRRALILEEYVAETLRWYGLPARRISSNEWDGQSDHGDIKIGDSLLLEVKSTTRTFTGPEDWPFPVVYIDGCKAWSGKPKPWGVVIVQDSPVRCPPWISRDGTTHPMMGVLSSTRPVWTIQSRWDGALRVRRQTLEAPVSCLLRWSQFVAELQADKKNGGPRKVPQIPATPDEAREAIRLMRESAASRARASPRQQSLPGARTRRGRD